MKTIKRSLTDRFYNRGYRAGIGGKSREICP
ncbi:MAG: ribosome modulation factor, partial [Litoricolaceae bacterium]|nr:ribosome modulation factor [Litorivicinaceae bacterium]